MEKVEKAERELSGLGKDSANLEQNIELARILCRGAAYLMQGRLNDSFPLARVPVVLRKKSFICHFRYLMHCESGVSIVKDGLIYLSPSVTHIDTSPRLCLCTLRGLF